MKIQAIPEIIKERDTPGPASVAATTPVKTITPVPITAPMLIRVKSKTPRVRSL